MKISQAVLLILIVTAGAVAMAAEHGGHGFDEHAKRTILWQCLNVGVMFAGLIYFLKKPVSQYFTDKKAAFLHASEKANEARKQAEDEHAEIHVRLTKLESTSDESISRAHAEAADMRNQLVADAQAFSKKIREEAELAAKNEVEKAKNHLREQLISDAIALAKNNIQSKVSTEDHKRLQGDFLNNIQAVRQ